MKQIDFLSIKLMDSPDFSKRYLKPHSTIKNRFILDLPNNTWKDREYHGEYFELYVDPKQNLHIKCSLPYLRNGHNYTEFTPMDAETTYKDLSEILEVDLFCAKVKAHEMGIIQHLKISFKKFRGMIGGIQGLDLQKSSKDCIIFGNSKKQVKIYHLKNNFNRKIDSQTKKKLQAFDLENKVKIELKYKSSKSKNLLDYLENETHLDNEELHNMILNDVIIAGGDYEAVSLSDILFKTLLTLSENYCTYEVVHNLILQEIECAELTSSQKWRRKKALIDKQEKINSSYIYSFSELLENPDDFLSF